MYTVDEVCEFLKDYPGFVEASKTSECKCSISVFNGAVDDYVEFLEYDDNQGIISNLLLGKEEYRLVNIEPLEYEFEIWLQDQNDDVDNSIRSFVTFLIDRTVRSTEFFIEDLFKSTCRDARDFIKGELE